MDSHPIVYRSDPAFESLDGLMKFRLHYEGLLYSSNGEAREGQIDRRGGHKHDIRRAFHRQLRQFWATDIFLSNAKGGREILKMPGQESEGPYDQRPSLADNLAEAHNISGQRFVPLVCAEFKILCKLDILLLRRDKPGGIIQARDIDNRLKTLFDALRMPKAGSEIGQCEFTEDEQPMYVLLQEDSLITTVTVETDELLDPPPIAGSDDGFVRMLITVDIRPYYVNMFNLAFA
jgi:hypothetical protein